MKQQPSCENCASACQSYGGVDSISSDAEITRILILANHTLGNVQSLRLVQLEFHISLVVLIVEHT